MSITSLKVLNTLNRFFSAAAEKSDKSFKKVRNLAEFLDSFLEKDSSETVVNAAKNSEILKPFKKKINDENDQKVNELIHILRHTILEDFKIPEVANEYSEIVNNLPKSVEFIIYKKYPRAVPAVKALLEEDFYTSLITKFPKHLAAYKRSGDSKTEEGKKHVRVGRPYVLVKTDPKHKEYLEKLVKAGTFEVQMERSSPANLAFITSPDTFSIPGHKDLEESINESEISLEIASNPPEFILNGETEPHRSSKVTFVPGKSETFKFVGRTKKGIIFEVAKRSEGVEDLEDHHGTLSISELKNFITYSVSHFLESKKSDPQEVTESQIVKYLKDTSDSNVSFDKIIEEFGTEADPEPEKKAPEKGSTPEERLEDREKELKGKEKERDREIVHHGLTKQDWEYFSPDEKDQAENAVDRFKKVLISKYDDVSEKTALGTIKDLLYTKPFVRSFLDSLFNPAVDLGSKVGISDWKKMIQDNAGAWITKDDVLKKVYINTVASQNTAKEALQAIRDNKDLNDLLNKVTADLNKKQLSEEEADRDETYHKIEEIKEKNKDREKKGLKPLELPEVKKNLKKIHPLVKNIKDEKVYLPDLKKLIESDDDLRKAVYSDENIAGLLTPKLSDLKVNKDVFGSHTGKYLEEFKKDLQDKIIKLGPSEFPSLIKTLKRKEKKEEDKKNRQTEEESRKELKGNPLVTHKSAYKSYSFVVRCAYSSLKSKGF